MTPRAFPPDLLARCPEEAARLIALRYLDDAVAARARLDDGSDAAALHDFRVAIRRAARFPRRHPPPAQQSARLS